ncbi:hypothetical protein VE03_06148 [Pseudogymnoascus sp. 23342-1-I1]|nr:hypothetical protein VE03_06148 [Pseudogymnoascus sp. 23342-1-I1]
MANCPVSARYDHVFGRIYENKLWTRALQARDQQAKRIMRLEGQRRLENWAEDQVVENLGADDRTQARSMAQAVMSSAAAAGGVEVEPKRGIRKRRVGDARIGPVSRFDMDTLRAVEGHVSEESSGKSSGSSLSVPVVDEEEPTPKRQKRRVGDGRLVPTPRVDTDALQARGDGDGTHARAAVARTESSSTPYPSSLDEEPAPRRSISDARLGPVSHFDLDAARTLSERILADHLSPGEGGTPLEAEPLLDLIKRHIAEARLVPTVRLDLDATLTFCELVGAELAKGAGGAGGVRGTGGA